MPGVDNQRLRERNELLGAQLMVAKVGLLNARNYLSYEAVERGHIGKAVDCIEKALAEIDRIDRLAVEVTG